MPCWRKAIPWSSADNLLTGKLSNLDHLRNDSRFEFQQIDINEPFDCGAVDYVFHFASPASPVDYAVHGIATLKVGRWARFMLSMSRASTARNIWSLRLRNVMAIRWNILRRKPTGAM